MQSATQSTAANDALHAAGSKHSLPIHFVYCSGKPDSTEVALAGLGL